jgi:hypothetical protein
VFHYFRTDWNLGNWLRQLYGDLTPATGLGANMFFTLDAVDDIQPSA